MTLNVGSNVSRTCFLISVFQIQFLLLKSYYLNAYLFVLKPNSIKINCIVKLYIQKVIIITDDKTDVWILALQVSNDIAYILLIYWYYTPQKYTYITCGQGLVTQNSFYIDYTD